MSINNCYVNLFSKCLNNVRQFVVKLVLTFRYIKLKTRGFMQKKLQNLTNSKVLHFIKTFSKFQ